KAVAYLHDVIEDTWATTGDLKNAGFSDEIIEAVKLLTRDKDMDYEKYIENLCKNPVAKTVKLADLEHNSQIDRIKNPTEKDYKRQAKYL
ncbi:guanosine-3',5'-bis(diphosphate) 3'-pyrophosphohydrolase, partial [Acinetobacter pittii]|nr:guanosine-3',5'-bis(diphosphate) 3'-pyrophosphohydrolase [Acinetobacter pittii]